MLKYISNADHFKEVLSRVQSVKHMLWIGTADIKDLYVEVEKREEAIPRPHCPTHSMWCGGETHSRKRAWPEFQGGL